MTFVGAMLDGKSVAFMKRSQLESLIRQRYAQANLSAKDIGVRTSFRDAGIEANVITTANNVFDYPILHRFLPFSGVYYAFHNQHKTVPVYNEYKLSLWAESVASACARGAIDASIIATPEGSLKVQPSQQGRSCDSQAIVNRVRRTSLSESMVVDVAPKLVEPRRSDQEVTTLLATIDPIVREGIQVKALDKTITADAKTIVSWLQFTENDAGQLTANVDPTKIQDFINSAQKTVYIAPGTTTIQVRDGVEVSRSIGSTGRGIDQTRLAQDIQSIINDRANRTIEARVTSLRPKEVVQGSYSNTVAGLQALLDHLAVEKGNVAIAVTEIGGQGRRLSANGSRTYHPASTYKLPVAYSVIKRIETGQLKWDDQIGGRSVESCVEAMIVVSDNACAEAFANSFTWSAVSDEARALGMSNTYLSSRFVSTASDQALFLFKLQTGQLMNQDHTTKLLGYMSRQKYRSGIPIGTGVAVADKVGFVNSVIHDSAIVYAPSGTYVLVIYTSNSNWSTIADIARQINTLLGS